MQRFEGVRDYPEDIVCRWPQPGGAVIYAAEGHGVHLVDGDNGILFERLGGTGSWLGFPISDEIVIFPGPGQPRSSVQDFEGGRIFRKDGQAATAAALEVLRYLAERSLERQFGFPVAAAEPPRADDGTTIQFFEGGLVTIQGGVKRAWLPPRDQARPAPTPVPERAVPGRHVPRKRIAGPPPEWAARPPRRPPAADPARVAVTMPQLGDDVTVGTVTRWLKRAGERAGLGEPLAEVSTDNVDVEIPSPAAGIVVSIIVEGDETVAVGATLAVIEPDRA
jgi:biotin carboxyl carrier protein